MTRVPPQHICLFSLVRLIKVKAVMVFPNPHSSHKSPPGKGAVLFVKYPSRSSIHSTADSWWLCRRVLEVLEVNVVVLKKGAEVGKVVEVVEVVEA